jgi:transposase
MRPATEIRLSNKEQVLMERLANASSTEQRLAFRARIILLAASGMSTAEISKKLNTRPTTVSKWRIRFDRDRVDGLRDAPRSGQPKKYTDDTEMRVRDALKESPPEGYSQWNGRLLAEHLKLPAGYVWKVMRKHRIQLQRRRSWCESTDPEFAEKAADVVGVYLNPPENAIVLCVDEKPHIQALQRAQGYLTFADGKTMSGFSHEYKRHGTSTLFAALEVATGQVRAKHTKRRRRREFLDFMNDIVGAYGQDKQIHVILDNLNTHKPKKDRWLGRHKNVHFHFIPTHSSWMNMVEVWFSILSRHALQGASFISVRQLRDAISRYIDVYNETANPFEWRKEKVYAKKISNIGN